MGILFKFILLTGMRDKLYFSILIILAGVFGLSSLVGFSAISEEAKMQLVYFSFLSRLVIVCGMILFICFYINKEFEHKEIDFILAKPISRSSLIFSYWISFTLISLILIIPTLIVITFFIKPNIIGLIWWGTSLILEIMLVSTFAIVCSLILKSAVASVLASISFYFIGRMMGFFVYSIALPNNIESFKGWQLFSESLLKIVSSIFPRLDLFGKTEWLVYGVTNNNDIYIVLLQSLVYIPLMLFMAFYDFGRKQF
jgi:ABC-type transport system involved in multi-copper enzyme maturation permease subunit